MAINDAFMLPKWVRTMEPMGDLLAAEQAELDRTQRSIAAQEKQLTISTSTYLLPRHERLFALPVNTAESLEVRRARVLAKLNTRGTTTVPAICDLVKIFTGQRGVVEEHFGLYAFSVFIELPAGVSTACVQELIRQIEVIKPAHLLLQAMISFPALPSALTIRVSPGPRVSRAAPPPYRAQLGAGRIPAACAMGTRSSTVTLPMAAYHEGG